MGPANLKLKLLSEFTEPYDHHFAGLWADGPVWHRNPKATRTRVEDHALLREHEFKVPEGKSLGEQHPDEMVVAYTNEYAHTGTGKICGRAWRLRIKLRLDPSTYSIPMFEPQGVSRRLLGAGRVFYGFEYRTQTVGEWRSNVDSEVTLVEYRDWPIYESTMNKILTLQAILGEPLIAIDFVGPDFDFAVDLNTAPGIPRPWTEGVDGREIAESIAARYEEIHGPLHPR